MNQHQLDPKQDEKPLTQRRPAAVNAPSADIEANSQSETGQHLRALQSRYGNRHVQRVVNAAREGNPIQAKQARPRPNRTGLPDPLKAGVEALSGLSLDDVRVHYNSSKPAELEALAYTQDTDIHIAPGQEKHLPHEAWHVVQQMQGRVKPTIQMKNGTPVNDDAALEKEADKMGANAVQRKKKERQDTGKSVEGGTMQFRAAIDLRKKQIRRMRLALKEIPARAGNATPDEVVLHDGAIGAGQHHRNRIVAVNALRADLLGEIEERRDSQDRDNRVLLAQPVGPQEAAQL